MNVDKHLPSIKEDGSKSLDDDYILALFIMQFDWENHMSNPKLQKEYKKYRKRIDEINERGSEYSIKKGRVSDVFRGYVNSD